MYADLCSGGSGALHAGLDPLWAIYGGQCRG